MPEAKKDISHKEPVLVTRHFDIIWLSKRALTLPIRQLPEKGLDTDSQQSQQVLSQTGRY
eukprot:1142486-Pelagomonas_calceolata.AAC.3